MTIINNTSAITKKLDEWNLAHNWPRETGTGTGTEASGGEDGDAGCGCRSDPRDPAWLGLPALVLLGLRRRRA